MFQHHNQLTPRQRSDLAERARREHWERKRIEAIADAEIEAANGHPVVQFIDILLRDPRGGIWL